MAFANWPKKKPSLVSRRCSNCDATPVARYYYGGTRLCARCVCLLEDGELVMGRFRKGAKKKGACEMSDGGPAFPVPNYVSSDGETFSSEPSGMSLRDYFAAAAMQGMLADGESTPAKILAAASYELADAMIEQRRGTK